MNIQGRSYAEARMDARASTSFSHKKIILKELMNGLIKKRRYE
jgi:hypothetical protein